MDELFNVKPELRDIDSVEKFEFEPIKGYPRLRWQGKRGFSSTQYYPAQLKESFGDETEGWYNKLYWGDNLQVMSHLLKSYRGKVDLIYIDPPFDSKADYKRTIELRGKKASNDSTSFEEKQYSDIWVNDEYLQFMYERLIIMRELLSETGSIYLHCDWHKVHLLRCIMDEVFGASNFVNEIVWQYYMGGKGSNEFAKKHDNILFYAKIKGKHTFNKFAIKRYYDFVPSLKDDSKNSTTGKDEVGYWGMVACPDVWSLKSVFNMGGEWLDYPTQKPETLIERIIKASTNEGDLVFDCFMGSGTTQAVAMKMGRRFLGADINVGAIDTTVSRLVYIQEELTQKQSRLKFGDGEGEPSLYYPGFEVYNVNNYDVFRNPVEAKQLLLQALELQPLSNNGLYDDELLDQGQRVLTEGKKEPHPWRGLYDGEKDGRMWKIMPVNRIATRADLNELIVNFPLDQFDKRKNDNPNKPVESITLVCMGHEPDLASQLKLQMEQYGYHIDVEVLDILTDRKDIEFKRDSDADIVVEGNKLVIRDFYPMNLLQKLSMEKTEVEDWRMLVSSIKIDFNYDDSVFSPTVLDVPEKKEIVAGVYIIPKDASRIRIKITDVLSESLERTIEL